MDQEKVTSSQVIKNQPTVESKKVERWSSYVALPFSILLFYSMVINYSYDII
jgi:hypothetical protein